MTSTCECASLGLKPDSNPAKLCSPQKKVMCVLNNSSLCPCRNLPPRIEVVSISEIPSYSVRCLLLSPAMRSQAGTAKQTEGRRHS